MAEPRSFRPQQGLGRATVQLHGTPPIGALPRSRTPSDAGSVASSALELPQPSKRSGHRVSSRHSVKLAPKRPSESNLTFLEGTSASSEVFRASNDLTTLLRHHAKQPSGVVLKGKRLSTTVSLPSEPNTPSSSSRATANLGDFAAAKRHTTPPSRVARDAISDAAEWLTPPRQASLTVLTPPTRTSLASDATGGLRQAAAEAGHHAGKPSMVPLLDLKRALAASYEKRRKDDDQDSVCTQTECSTATGTATATLTSASGGTPSGRALSMVSTPEFVQAGIAAALGEAPLIETKAADAAPPPPPPVRASWSDLMIREGHRRRPSGSGGFDALLLRAMPPVPASLKADPQPAAAPAVPPLPQGPTPNVAMAEEELLLLRELEEEVHAPLQAAGPLPACLSTPLQLPPEHYSPAPPMISVVPGGGFGTAVAAAAHSATPAAAASPLLAPEPSPRSRQRRALRFPAEALEEVRSRLRKRMDKRSRRIAVGRGSLEEYVAAHM